MRDNIKSTIPAKLFPYTLPVNWKWFYWSDLIKEYQQGLIRSNSQLGNGNVSYLKMGDVQIDGTCNLSKLIGTNANEIEISNYRLFQHDFLINVRNSKELVGKSCVIPDVEEKTILFNHMLVRIKHIPGIPNNFINAYLNIPSSKKLIDNCKQGTTTVIALYKRDLYNIPVPLPDDYTLKYIDTLYSRLASKIELNNRINTELESMAKTLYDYWFVQFDFPDANGKPYKASGGKMVWNEELKREIPEGWEIKALSDVASLIARGVSPKYIEEGGILVLNQKCVRNKSVIASFGRRHNHQVKNATSKLIEVNDVLVNSTGVGTLGRTALIKKLDEEFVTVDSHVTVVRIDELKANKFFTGYSLTEKQDDIEKLGNGSTGQTELSRVQLGNVQLFFPPRELQTRFDDIARPLFQKIANSEVENNELVKLRDWLLPMLMNGQVSVGEVEELGMVAEQRNTYGE